MQLEKIALERIALQVLGVPPRTSMNAPYRLYKDFLAKTVSDILRLFHRTLKPVERLLNSQVYMVTRSLSF
jgi:hypothetical protein